MGLNITGFLLLLAMTLVVIRGLKGPTFYDRLLSSNMFGTISLLLLLLIGYLSDRPEFADIAMAYALLSFIGTIVILKFVRYRSMSIEMRHHKSKRRKTKKENV